MSWNPAVEPGCHSMDLSNERAGTASDHAVP